MCSGKRVGGGGGRQRQTRPDLGRFLDCVVADEDAGVLIDWTNGDPALALEHVSGFDGQALVGTVLAEGGTTLHGLLVFLDTTSSISTTDADAAADDG